MARERFKGRLLAGERVGACGCDVDDPVMGPGDNSPVDCVVGARFRDSGRVYYFHPADITLDVGDWIVVPTGRGHEAARVVIAPHQVRRAMLQGEVNKVVRRLDDDDIGRMEAQRRNASVAIRRFGEQARERRLGVKPIAADYSFDGTAAIVSYSVPDRDRTPDAAALRDLARDLASELACRVELRQVGPRDEARLLGGLGRCGRTLCCSSWLPVFPEISMSMAKNQDLPLNPAKVSGVCGRLLCCLSYENEQYRQMKAVMPKLGQPIETPHGAGQVVSIQLLKDLVTVRMEHDHSDVTFPRSELGFGDARAATSVGVQAVIDTAAPAEPDPESPSENAEGAVLGARRRRRRRGGRRPAPG